MPLSLARQVIVQALEKYGDKGGKTKRLSKLSLIDLAGTRTT